MDSLIVPTLNLFKNELHKLNRILWIYVIIEGRDKWRDLRNGFYKNQLIYSNGATRHTQTQGWVYLSFTDQNILENLRIKYLLRPEWLIFLLLLLFENNYNKKISHTGRSIYFILITNSASDQNDPI
jgi:phage terminase large subunit-like protein